MDTQRQDQAYSPGKLIAERYEVIAPVGAGANGIVLHVRDRLLDDDKVALKILSSYQAQDPVTSGRFRTELMASRKLSHPNILKLYDFGKTADGASYLSMEFVPGETLISRIQKHKESPIAFEDALYVLFQLTSALAFAHGEKVIHRDIKPENVLLSDGWKIKLADFGVARFQEMQNGFTQTGEGIGTPIYMAPEQMNAKYVDNRADIYSVGILAYELIAGEPPFTGNNWMMLIAKHMSKPMPLLRDKGFDVPAWYDEWIQKATAKKAEERFDSIAEIRDIIAQSIPPSRLQRDSVVCIEKGVSSSAQNSTLNLILAGCLGAAIGIGVMALL